MPSVSAGAHTRTAQAGAPPFHISLSDVEKRAFRSALGAFATGVTVITTLDMHGKPTGLTVNSFASVSMDPPLVLWSQIKSAPSHPHFQNADTMVINVLSHEQNHLAMQFAQPSPDKFAGVACGATECGVPILEGCSAYFVCRKVAQYYGGDHTIYLCGVEKFVNNNTPPLIFCQGSFRQKHDL